MPVRIFSTISGRRKTMEVKAVDREKFQLIRFFQVPTENRNCYQRGKKGHLSANCPQKVRRVSLAEASSSTRGQGRLGLGGNMERTSSLC